MKTLVDGLEITEFAIDYIAAKTDEGKYEVHWDNESGGWSVTYWRWLTERDEYDRHEHMGTYINLALVLHTLANGEFYMLDDLEQA